MVSLQLLIYLRQTQGHLQLARTCFDFSGKSDIMSEENVLRIPRSDSPGDYVLVNVVSQRSTPLDLKLIATEGEAPYVGSGKPQ